MTAACKPRLLVELGTHYGVSYAAFCEAVARSRLATRCCAVDIWAGDAHAGFYGDDIYNELKDFHDKRYASFSELLRRSFDEACGSFEDGTIDLLHIDGYHTYEAVRHDFETWRPKLSERAVVLFHDTNVRMDDFGVWRFFGELRKELPSFEFLHGYGLGVVAVGADAPAAIRELCRLTQSEDIAAVRKRFSHFGACWTAVAGENLKSAELAARLRQIEDSVAQRDAQIAQSEGEFSLAKQNAEDLAARMRQLEDSVAQKDAQIAQSEGEFSLAKQNAKDLAARLRQLEDFVAQKDAQIGAKQAQIDEFSYHLNRINASPWWRFGMWFTGLICAPLQFIKSKRADLVANEPLDLFIALPLAYQVPAVLPIPRVAVLLHAYYTDLLSEIQQMLKNIPFPFKLFISTDTEQKKAIIEQSFIDWSLGPFEVHVFPNRGRDIAPKFVGFRDVHRDYEFVLHIHTKKSPHGNFGKWRPFLLNCLLGSPQIVAGIFEMFSQCPRLGIVAPRNFKSIRHWMTWGVNFDKCAKLAKRMGITLRRDSPIDFASGSMFWARSAALKPLLELNLTFDDFDEEQGQLDGELNHAIERLTFYSCEAAGYAWCHAGPANNLACFEEALNISSRGDLGKIPCAGLLSSNVFRGGALRSASISPIQDLKARMRARFLSLDRYNLRSLWKSKATEPAPAQRVSEKALNAVRHSSFFDTEFYLEANPDVKAAGVDPALHYLLRGGSEGRNPGPHFSTKKYLSQNPDVAAAGTNALVHYELHGRGEVEDDKATSMKRAFVEGLAARFRRLWKNNGQQSSPASSSYEKWVELYDTISEDDRRQIKKHIRTLEYQPLISIVMPAYDAPEKKFREAIASIRAQLYTNWELCVADDASPSPKVVAILEEMSTLDPRIKWMQRESNGHISKASNSALALATGEFVALMDHDDLLPEQALYEVVVELNAHPNADLIYSDEDKINDAGVRHSPYFKTDWNPELFLGQNMICHLGVYRRSIVERIGGFRAGFEGSQDYDLALRVVNATSADRIRHIPAVLYHWRSASQTTSFSERQLQRCVVAARRAKTDYFLARGEAAEVRENAVVPSWERIHRSIPAPPPLVSLIVPTRNRHDLLGPCMEGLLHRTTYQPIEIIIIDHQSDDPKTIALLECVKADERVRIMRYEGPFNYSDMNNKAVVQARGEIIGLINNDVDVIEPAWLSEMVSLAVMPEYGAVGAKLLYPNDRVQHGGVILGTGGVAGHAHVHAHRNETGYFGRLALTSNVSAVTGACLIVRKALFEEAGGLNAIDLPVAFNDIDLCLKIRAKGYRNVWTSFALLYHHESPSRGPDTAPANVDRARREVDYMLRMWGNQLDTDPYFNVNLSLQGSSFDLAFPPRRINPWRSAGIGDELSNR